MIRAAFVVAALLGALVACGPGVKGGPTMSSKINKPQTETAEAAESPVVSHAILAREPVANQTTVKHILVGWADLAEAYQGHQDQRAAKRTKVEAEAAVKDIVTRLAANEDFDALMKEFSEDAGSTASGKPFIVKPDAGLVIEFRQLSLRLNVGEYGVCQSDYGFHIIKRLE
ncbi:MAG: peptidylprolyl isomerase [Proteobacteria bacterium]|nr:peptidylprolyl isomerase [Pseudomonadota bacterium]